MKKYRNKQKKNIFVGVLKDTDGKSRIRIRKSVIRNTAAFHTSFLLSYLQDPQKYEKYRNKQKLEEQDPDP